jgi:hypothetical protein
VHEDPAATLTAYPGTVRQLIVTGLGRDAPTVIITNDRDATTRNLIRQYARRMTIEQRLAEIIRAFCADALSSTVNLNVDLDIMLAVLAQALLAALRARLPGYAAVTPTSSSAASWKPPARSSPPPTPSPSGSNAAPTHPSCAKPASPPPPSPGGAAGPCARSQASSAPTAAHRQLSASRQEKPGKTGTWSSARPPARRSILAMTGKTGDHFSRKPASEPRECTMPGIPPPRSC